MFAQACKTAAEFTRPVVISVRTAKGELRSSIGSFIVLNADGWILTAAHILDEGEKLDASKTEREQYEQERQRIEADTNLNYSQRHQRLKALGKPKDEWVTDFSFFWTFPGAMVAEGYGLAHVDLAIARLEPFDPAWITTYPILKDPGQGIDVGTSLCRLGFPFHSITPDFDDTTNNFTLPADSVPPFFPIEGILTRQFNVVVDPPPPTPPTYLQGFIETSSPGLRGQSGGPIFDQHGTVWGIQSQTRHYPLGFAPSVRIGNKDHTEHAFLHVGWGVHPATVVGFLNEHGVNHTISAY